MRSRSRYHGVAATLAMLYLVLFSTLALGFFAAATMSAQVARNERSVALAQLAAESGMQFIRYQLGLIVVPPTTTNAQLLSVISTGLASQLNGTANLGGDNVALSGSTINIPSTSTNYITLDSTAGTRFRAAITQSGVFIVVTVWGRGNDANVSRGIQLQFHTSPKAGAIFNYGVASKSGIVMNGNVSITGATDPTKGSVLSATAASVPLSMTGSVQISGDFSYTNAGASPIYGNGTIAGYGSSSASFASHVHSGVTPPTFPYVDTSVYQQYATNTWTTSTGKTLVNMMIPPNSNPSFTGNTTIQGILYIKAPNKVSFGGNVTIQGAIVVENNPSGDLTTNTLSFSGNTTVTSVSTLPANATFPAGERALTGAFLLAPNFAVSFAGNFGTIGGSIIASQFNFTGNAGGTVVGTVVNLNDSAFNMSGNSDIIIASTGTTNYPTGVSFGTYYTPLPGTYTEIVP